jgi:hypothetical protein
MKHAKPSKQCLIALFVALFALIIVFPIQAVRSQSSTDTIVSVVPQVSTARADDTLVINITISNVQNLFAVDVSLSWNTAVLQIKNAESRLGVSVLYNPVNTVEQTVSQETGEYHLVATSQNPADSFNGSGTIATLTFNVTSAGHSDLTLQSELADHPLPEEVSVAIEHRDTSGSVDAVIPEFPAIVVVMLLLVLATVALLFFKRTINKRLS